MIKRNSWDTFAYFFRAYPGRSAVMVLAFTLAGLLESVGVLSLLPLISLLTSGDVDQSFVSRFVGQVFSGAGIDFSVGNILLFFVSVMIFKAVLSLVAVFQIAYASAHVTADLRLNYIRSLFEAHWLHYTGLQSGASVNTLGTEAQRAALAFKQGCQTLAFGIQILMYLALALMVSWWFTLVALAGGGAMALLLGFLVRYARRAGQDQTLVFNRAMSFMTDALISAKPLKAMNKSGALFGVLEKEVGALQSAQRRIDLTDQSLWVLSEPLMIAFVAIGLYGALAYSALPLPTLLFLAVVFLRMVMRMVSAQRSYQVMVSQESALWSLLDKTREAQVVEDHRGGTATPVFDRVIALEDVSFSYQDKAVFQDLSVTLPARQFHVIFGPSGTGKTTLVDLVTGLLQPDQGRVLVDDQVLTTLDVKAWRQMIGYVPQEVLLFHDTILNNLTLRDDSLTRAQAEQALKLAGAWDFVQEMEDGLDSVVGERGSRLSGGQRQRIAIARAIISQPSLLVLDEATSALDPETEQAVLQTVKKLSASMTVLAISHNPAILDVADHVYTIRDRGLDVLDSPSLLQQNQA